jgi:hypothetical protein
MSSGCFGGCKGSTNPKPDNTPVGRFVHPCKTRNFVIILAGPGKYNPQDRDHDQFWGNYFVASQHVFGVYSHFSPATSLLAEECVHWLVYEKAYEARWKSDNDSKIVFLMEESKKYTNGYLARIKEYIGQLDKKDIGKHKYIAIDSYKDVWEALNKMPDKTLTRLYYFGHGGPRAFYMRWARIMSRTDAIVGDTTPDETIEYQGIEDNRTWLKNKVKPDDGQISKFFACTSSDWAKKWKEVTGLKSQGAVNKISFKEVRNNSALNAIETDSTHGWTSF